MTPEEQHAFLYGPGLPPPTVVPTPQQGKCANVKVTTQDGRVFNLGKPSSIFFPLRLWFYKFQRRHEMKEQANG